MPFGDKYLQRHELQTKTWVTGKETCSGLKKCPIFMLSPCLCWSGSAREIAVSTWLVSPALAPESRTTQGAEKAGHSFSLLCVFCWRGEPDGGIHSGGTEQWTLACWEEIQDHQFIFTAHEWWAYRFNPRARIDDAISTVADIQLCFSCDLEHPGSSFKQTACMSSFGRELVEVRG